MIAGSEEVGFYFFEGLLQIGYCAREKMITFWRDISHFHTEINQGRFGFHLPVFDTDDVADIVFIQIRQTRNLIHDYLARCADLVYGVLIAG